MCVHTANYVHSQFSSVAGGWTHGLADIPRRRRCLSMELIPKLTSHEALPPFFWDTHTHTSGNIKISSSICRIACPCDFDASLNVAFHVKRCAHLPGPRSLALLALPRNLTGDATAGAHHMCIVWVSMCVYKVMLFYLPFVSVYSHAFLIHMYIYIYI